MPETIDQSFGKHERLLKRAQFQHVFDARSSAARGGLVVHMRPNGLAFGRLGLAVAARYGNSVHRNRFKRLVRETFRLNKTLFAGYDMIVSPRSPIEKPTLETVRADLFAAATRAMEKAGSS